MSIMEARVPKKSELWLAFAGDKLTLSANIDHYSRLYLSFDGPVKDHQQQAEDIVLAYLECNTIKSALLDFSKMDFFSNGDVDEDAVDLLLDIISWFNAQQTPCRVQLPSTIIKETFEKICQSSKFKIISFSAPVGSQPDLVHAA